MAEPILWANKSQRTQVVVVNGEQRTERIPQRGHTGNSDYDKPEIARFARWIRVIKGCGTDARVPITNGAAHIDSGSEYGRMIQAKGRFLGWIPVDACPCALLLTGTLKKRHIVSKEVLGGTPCAPGTYSMAEPCPHLVAERDARQTAHTDKQRKQAVSLKSEVEKLLDGQKEQTKQLVDAVASGIENAVEKLAQVSQQPKKTPKDG